MRSLILIAVLAACGGDSPPPWRCTCNPTCDGQPGAPIVAELACFPEDELETRIILLEGACRDGLIQGGCATAPSCTCACVPEGEGGC